MNMSAAFQTYIDYIFLKRHFSDEQFIWSESANYKRMKLESFLKRRDVAFFNALHSLYKSRKPILEHLISCFLYDNNFWIGDALKDEYIMRHQNRMMRFGALERTFVDDCEKIVFNQVNGISLTTGSHSSIMELYPSTICLETLSILEHFTGFTRIWFPINPLQKWRRLLVHKYNFLLRLNERNMEKIQNAYQSLNIQ